MGKNPKQIDFVRVADLAASQNPTILIGMSSVRPPMRSGPHVNC